MTNRSHGDRIRIVADIVCDAIPLDDAPADPPTAVGRNEGVRMIADIVDTVGDDRPPDEPRAS
jgi:hypothetical protein